MGETVVGGGGGVGLIGAKGGGGGGGCLAREEGDEGVVGLPAQARAALPEAGVRLLTPQTRLGKATRRADDGGRGTAMTRMR